MFRFRVIAAEMKMITLHFLEACVYSKLICAEGSTVGESWTSSSFLPRGPLNQAVVQNPKIMHYKPDPKPNSFLFH